VTVVKAVSLRPTAAAKRSTLSKVYHMQKIIITALAAFLLSSCIASAQCDFNGAPSGICEATISLGSPTSENGAFSTELVVKSSAECSKVSFRNGPRLDTSFVREGVSRETLTTDKPIAKDDVTVTSCQAFGGQGDTPRKAAATDTPPEPKPGTLTGRWNSNHYVYWDLWEMDGKIVGTSVIQLDDKRKPTYQYVTGSRNGKTLTFHSVVPQLKKLSGDRGYSIKYRILNTDAFRNLPGNVTMTRQQESTVDRMVRSLAGQWTSLDGGLTYSITDKDGNLTGTGSSTGDWPELVGEPKADSKVDLSIEGTRKANEVSLTVRDNGGKATTTNFTLKNDNTLWQNGSMAMIRQ
jgi:hypothetical protein